MISTHTDIRSFEACVCDGQVVDFAGVHRPIVASFLTPSPHFSSEFESALFPTFAFQSPVIISMPCLAVRSVSSWIFAFNFIS